MIKPHQSSIWILDLYLATVFQITKIIFSWNWKKILILEIILETFRTYEKISSNWRTMFFLFLLLDKRICYSLFFVNTSATINCYKFPGCVVLKGWRCIQFWKQSEIFLLLYQICLFIFKTETSGAGRGGKC